MSEETQSRKLEHIKVCLTRNVDFNKSNGFEKYELTHYALPDMNPEKVDTKTKFLDKTFDSPLFISAMTGGVKEAIKINKNLAQAAQDLNIGMGVGSQRAILENPDLAETYKIRDVAPDIFLVGNIGICQLQEYETDRIIGLVDTIDANALAVHLNPAQEITQKDGGIKNWEGLFKKLEKLCSQASFPIIAKEVGCGISGDVGKKLKDIGVKVIDVAGAGGTSWVKVDYIRGSKISDNFLEWGIPTAECLVQCSKLDMPLIASGGIRTGIEVAKSIALGASLAGLAQPLLKASLQSPEDVKKILENIIGELKTAMFLSGAKNIEKLGKVKLVKV